MWLVMCMKESITIQMANMAPEYKTEQSLVWAEGMMGVMPVFKTRKSALEYYPDHEIVEIKVKGEPDEK